LHISVGDACKLDSDHPSYYCPRGQQECVTACAENDEHENCVVQTNRQFAATAPKPLAKPTPPPTTATQQASAGPAIAAVHKVPESSRGECDNQGTWNLKIGDATGHAVGCTGLSAVPRDVSFRIERQKDLFALHDLIPAPGWQDGFSVENHEDVCVVTLTRDNHSDAERPRTMLVQLAEKDGKVTGTFHYREDMLQPIDCRLDALVSGVVHAPAPRAAPPIAPQPPTMQAVPQTPSPGTPHVGGGVAPTGPTQRNRP
jgi:hypothetical protein